MKMVLTYDPHWEYTPGDRTPFWASLDTVEYVARLLEQTGVQVSLVPTDEAFEVRLRDILQRWRRPLVFWLNEFMRGDGGKDVFTVGVLENMGLLHTGPGCRALGTGLDKEATKKVFRRLGLPTPESYVVLPGGTSTIGQRVPWPGHAIVKPLLQGNSRGMDQGAVVPADDLQLIRERVEAVHREFDEPALVEKYIGGEGVREFTIPMLIAHDGRVAALPITEIDLSKIPAAQGQFRFLTHAIKDEKYYLKVPAQLPAETHSRMYGDVARVIAEMGCRDMVRVDVRADATGMYFLEVNANPGKNRFSYLTTSAYSLGLAYPQIIAFIPYQAMLKYGLQPPVELQRLVEPVMALFRRPGSWELPTPRKPTGHADDGTWGETFGTSSEHQRAA